MNKETILSRQILTYMLLLTFVIIAIAILGSYLFYSFLIYYLPGGMNEGSEDAMTFLDWMWILMASITSLVVALFFTVKLSARIFNPLNDVAYSLKQISQGNLSARAFNSSSKLGEMNRLVMTLMRWLKSYRRWMRSEIYGMLQLLMNSGRR